MMAQAENDDFDEKPKRRLFAPLSVAGLFLALAGLMVYYLYPPYSSSKNFETPKLTDVHLDEEPFMRMPLPPGASFRPIELMTGTDAHFICGCVKVGEGKSRFVLKAFGKTFEWHDCVFDVPVPDQVAQHSNFEVIFYNNASDAEPTDSMTIPVVIVQNQEVVEFHQIENEAHQQIELGGVPDKIYVYARAAVALPEDGREYGALFFTADPANGVPVLELKPVLEGEKAEPMIGDVIRFRAYGKDMAGYAFWTPEPIDVTGRNHDRSIVDIYVGIFKRSEIPSVMQKTLKVEFKGEDSVMVTPMVSSADEVRPLTMKGRLLSKPLHVVRNAPKVKMDGTAGKLYDQHMQNL